MGSGGVTVSGVVVTVCVRVYELVCVLMCSRVCVHGCVYTLKKNYAMVTTSLSRLSFWSSKETLEVPVKGLYSYDALPTVGCPCVEVNSWLYNFGGGGERN